MNFFNCNQNYENYSFEWVVKNVTRETIFERTTAVNSNIFYVDYYGRTIGWYIQMIPVDGMQRGFLIPVGDLNNIPVDISYSSAKYGGYCEDETLNGNEMLEIDIDEILEKALDAGDREIVIRVYINIRQPVAITVEENKPKTLQELCIDSFAKPFQKPCAIDVIATAIRLKLEKLMWHGVMQFGKDYKELKAQYKTPDSLNSSIVHYAMFSEYVRKDFTEIRLKRFVVVTSL